MEKNLTNMSLGEFLRTRRNRLTTEDVGLVSYGRRRTPGLRREEVAQLAHIGTSWYTSLEQGRNVNPSEDVLNNIAKALRLNEAERNHLHLLAKPVQKKVKEQQLNVGLVRTIRSLDPNPALIIGRYWDLLLWNKAAELVFRLPSFINNMQQRPNWMRHLLIREWQSLNKEDLEAGIKVLIAQFRADYAHFPNDPMFKELIEEFIQSSQLFREIWSLHDVQWVTERHKRSYDPRIGEMEFEHVTLQLPTDPDLKIMIYTASSDTATRLRNLMSIREH